MDKNRNDKTILAIETSAETCGASLFFNKRKFVDFNINEKNVHSEKLLEVIDSVLSSYHLGVNDLSAIAVSIGPGSFTGLRIGLSVAKGLALGANLPILPVPTFFAVADFISGFLPKDEKFVLLRKVNVLELYGEIYRSTDNGFEIVREMEILSKNDAKEFVGNGKVFSDSKIMPVQNNFPEITASIIARWAFNNFKENLIFDYDYLEPNYFKKFIPRVNK